MRGAGIIAFIAFSEKDSDIKPPFRKIRQKIFI